MTAYMQSDSKPAQTRSLIHSDNEPAWNRIACMLAGIAFSKD